MQDLREKLASAIALGIAKELLRRTLFDNQPIRHEHSSIRYLPGKPDLMGDAYPAVGAKANGQGQYGGLLGSCAQTHAGKAEVKEK